MTDHSAPDHAARPVPGGPSPVPLGPPGAPVGGGAAGGVPGTPAPPPGRKQRRTGAERLGLIAVALALVALVLAAGSALFAWRAIDQARDAKDIAIGRGPVDAPPPGEPTPDAPPAPDNTATGELPTPVPGTSPGTLPPLDPRTNYDSAYDKQELVLRAPGNSCYSGMNVDLDEPRADVGSSGYDLVLLECNDQLKFSLGPGVRGSDAGAPGMTAQDCDDRIRTNPIPRDATIPARKGLAMCVTPSRAQALNQGDSWRIVLVEVVDTSISESVTVQLTAWKIPG